MTSILLMGAPASCMPVGLVLMLRFINPRDRLDFMLSLSDNNQAAVVEAFNSTSRA